jgi:hypothetical protein
MPDPLKMRLDEYLAVLAKMPPEIGERIVAMVLEERQRFACALRDDKGLLDTPPWLDRVFGILVVAAKKAVAEHAEEEDIQAQALLAVGRVACHIGFEVGRAADPNWQTNDASTHVRAPAEGWKH